MDLYNLYDDAIDGFAEWHYTEGWGNLFTVTVASIAIISSVVVSVITLRRNARQFEQNRSDARNDKLRAEIAALLSTLGERRSRQTVYVKRVNESVSAAGATALGHFSQNLRAIFAESISPVYEQAMGHTFAIMLLTEDPSLVDSLMRIQKALKDEQGNFEKTLSLADRAATGDEVSPAEFEEEARRAKNAQDVLEKHITAASADLMLKAVQNLSPLGHAFASVDSASLLKRVEDAGKPGRPT